VLVGEYLLGVNEPIEISFHLLSHDVHVLVVRHVRRLLNVDQFDDVLVIKELCKVIETRTY
jgi:hypothetical protein